MKHGLASSSAFVLVEWGSIILSKVWEKYDPHLCLSFARVLDLCVSSGKRTIKDSAIVIARRAIRNLLGQKPRIVAIIRQLTAKDQPLGGRTAVLLGVIAGVCARKNKNLLVKDQYYAFYVREIIGSRTAIPSHIASAFNDFFKNFTTATELQREVVPTLEKTLLRAPEVVQDLVRPMVHSLPSEVDLAEIIADHLLKPLLANTKSQTAVVRDGASSAFAALIAHAQEEKFLGKIVNDLLTSFSKLTVVEQRGVHARMLAQIPYVSSRSETICRTIAKSASKEPNETALAAEVTALTAQYAQMVLDSQLDRHKKEHIKDVEDAFAKGLSEKKPGVRKIWALGAGDFLWKVAGGSHRASEKAFEAPPAVVDFVESIAPKLLQIFEEVTQSPIVAGSIAVVAFTTTALCPVMLRITANDAIKASLRKAKIYDRALSQASFLLNHRVYTKLSSQEDLPWVVRALVACSNDLEKASADIKDAWTQTLLYLIAAAGIPPSIRNEAMTALTNVWSQRSRMISEMVIQGLWHWQRQTELSEKDSAALAAKSGTSQLFLAVRSISPRKQDINQKDYDSMQTQLINMLVLCRPEILPRVHWIETCLRVGQDPGTIARTSVTKCLQVVDRCLTPIEGPAPSATVKIAAYNTAAELAFVAPDTITPLLIGMINSNLPTDELKQYGPTEIAIARTQEGITFVDVLSSKAQSHAIDKNAKDYDTMKWEQEIRNQVAQKRGQDRKLTPDEKARVQAQLTKEAAIRADVQGLESRLLNGIGFVRALAIGPPIDPGLWLNQALQSLVNAIAAGVGRLVGPTADETYLECSRFVSSRLGSMRPFIGIATLRALGSFALPEELVEEPLGDLVTRLLYRLRLASEQRPFDSISLIYVLPLVFAVLQQGGIARPDVDEADEQITLALEILSFHTDTCEFAVSVRCPSSCLPFPTDFLVLILYVLFWLGLKYLLTVRTVTDRQLPRGLLLRLLIESMQRFSQHYKIIKDTISDVCRAISENATPEEVAILLKGGIVPQISVRTAVLQAIRDHIDLTEVDYSDEIWLACHDDLDENVELGHLIWQENGLEVEPEHAFKMLPYLASQDRQLRRAASRALAEAVGKAHGVFSRIVDELKDQYRELAKPRLPERDAFGMPKRNNLSDPWENRSGIAQSFRALAPNFVDLVSFVDFLVQDRAVGDQNATVRDEMIEAATTIIRLHGATQVEELMRDFEIALDESDANTDSSDLVNEAVVILYGALARHLRKGDDRVPKVVQRLLTTLNTPSETVQYAVAGCLPALVQTSSHKTSEYIHFALDQSLQSKKYAARRGGAYGLAGIVKGKGISSLREFRIMSTLNVAIDNKKDQNHRQGALFAYELLALVLGRTFEPYIIQIVPQLLASFGDTTADVREACLDTSKTCFASLSSYGVKIILPTLLEGLEESQWRSKKGACDLLGAMAYLDPQQLALSLPDIIPPLTSVLSDSHKEVRLSANRSLQRFGEVISNPEVKGLVSILLKALSDPTKHTDEALNALIKVSFIHYLDSPSLALIVRILERGLGDRSATKRKSAQIIGSLAHLTERKDVTPHLPILVAGLKLAVVDPVPATRATASKALGSLVEKLGEDALPDLIPSLMSTLKSDTGAGDRLGSAQALSEVLAGLGTGRLEETLPTILQNVASAKPTVREGFMSLFIYLPACFGNSFASYLSKIIPPILSGLADEVESIRETSLRAGRLLVKNFATKAIDLLLPELDRGLADDSYRIRLSSVELVGDLLFNLTGISGKTEQDEEEEGAAEAGQSLLEVLGEDKRNKILSSLYICRCDTSGLVRTAAVYVWKALVATPRTLKELIPTLTQLLIRRLASSNMEQKVIAGNALGELIRKAGEGVLASLLPTLEEGLQTSNDTDSKQGICIALKEIISSASEEALEEYEKTLISVVRVALVDCDDEVREAAAEAFDSLQKILGKKAVDQVLPYLLSLLRTEGEADTALSALLTLLTDNTRSNIILPNLVPTLLVSPISSFNAKAIASLSEVAGSAMTRRLPAILNALMDNIIVCNEDALRSELEDSFDSILLSMDEYDGLNTAMSVLLALVKNNDHRKRANVNVRLSKFFAKSDIDFSRYHQDLIRVLLISFDDSDSEVIKAAWLALSELTKRLKKEEMETLVISTRQILQQVGVPGHNLPGFLLPKGINAILPIFLQGLMNGTADQRTHAALAISNIIDRTNADSLKPFVTQITGPLIRVVSERSVDVKAAILLTLNNLLEKIPTFLKPFLPQLQRTFAKSLADTSSEVLRSRAAKALGTLITMTPRIDPLIAELVTGSKTPDPGVQNAMLKALYQVVSKAGASMGEASRNAILGLIDGDISQADDSMIITHARLFGALIKSLPKTFDPSSLIKTRVLTSHMSNATALNLNSVLLESPATLTEHFASETPNIICHGIRSKNVSPRLFRCGHAQLTNVQTFFSDNCVLAAGKYLLTPKKSSELESSKAIIEALAAAIAPGGQIDTRRLSLVVIRTVSRTDYDLIGPNLSVLAPPIFASVRDPVIPVKLAAEAAFLSIFSVVESESTVFDEYMADAGTGMNPTTKRSMTDYFKRIAVRLGSQARERKDAEGGQGGLGLSNDEREDEREIWSVGKVDLGEKAFSDD